jgi:hypothetical protein
MSPATLPQRLGDAFRMPEGHLDERLRRWPPGLALLRIPSV